MKYMILLLITNTIFCVTCGSGDNTYSVKKSDGVRYVHNSATLWGDKSEIELEFVRKFGGADVEDENYQLFRPSYTACDSEENLYVVDSGNHRIQVYDKEGKFLRSFGRRGNGPGEFERPGEIQINNIDEVYVMDTPTKLIHLFEIDGSLVKSFRIPGLTEDFLMLNSGEVVTSYGKALYSDPEYQDQTHAKVNAIGCVLKLEEGNIVPFGEPYELEDENLQRLANSAVFSNDNSDNIYTVFLNRNRIEKYSKSGELLWKSNRPFEYDIKFYYRQITINNGSVPKTYNIPASTYVAKEIDVDGKGRLWVTTFNKQPEIPNNPNEVPEIPEDLFKFEIFTNEGMLLGCLPFDRPYYSMDIHRNRIYLTTYNDSHEVYVYQIVELSEQ